MRFRRKHQHSDSPLPAYLLWVHVNIFNHIFRGRKPALSISHTENPGNMRTNDAWQVIQEWQRYSPQILEQIREQRLLTVEDNGAMF